MATNAKVFDVSTIYYIRRGSIVVRALHAKMLSGQDLSSVQTVLLGFETVDNDDYATWLLFPPSLNHKDAG